MTKHPPRPRLLRGRLRRPTAAELHEYMALHGLDPSEAEAADLRESVDAAMAAFDRLEELEPPAPPLRYAHRDPGRRPTPDEDPYNALIRRCEVRGAAEGPLAGVAVVIKDCIAVAGVPTSNGGRRVPRHVPVEDAVVVERLLDAGATIVGKSNLDDLGTGFGGGSAFGAARNPADPAKSTGGSSSGSAAAVAAGIADMALGVDQGGSVRLPAAWCGIVGMKPTHGLVPTYGVTHIDHTIDHVGPMTRTVLDNARMLEVIAGPDWRDPQWAGGRASTEPYSAARERGIEGVRLGIVRESVRADRCEAAVLDRFQAACEKLEGLGARVTEVSVPLWDDGAAIITAVILLAEYNMLLTFGEGSGHLGRIDPSAVAAMAAQLQSGRNDLPALLKTALVAVEHVRRAYGNVPAATAQNVRLELRRAIDALLVDVDLLVTPTSPKQPFALEEDGSSDQELLQRNLDFETTGNLMQADLTGHPALSVPAGFDAEGMPIGFQLIGPHFGESLIYSVALALEDDASTIEPIR